MLKFFKVDPKRHQLVVDIEAYQLNLIGILALAQQQDGFNPDLGPSWTKTVANPNRSKGFFTRMLQALFLGQHGFDSLNVDDLVTTLSKAPKLAKTRVAMMFLPGNTRNDNLTRLVEIAKEALPNFMVIEVSGNTTTNFEAEDKVNYEIEQATKAGKSVLILSAGMASRSFSVSEITELYLAFDEGGVGPTIQKMSRALTPGNLGKVGRIFSLSFDPNRDMTFDALILQTALNFQKKHPENSMKNSLANVLSTFDIFRCQEGNSFQLNGDDYLLQLLARDSIARYVGKTADFSQLEAADILVLAHGCINIGAPETEAADRGKTKKPSDKKASHEPTAPRDPSVDEEKKAREMVVTIIENINLLFLAANTTNLDEVFDILSTDPEMAQSVLDEFGVTLEVMKHLFKKGVINQNAIELLK